MTIERMKQALEALEEAANVLTSDMFAKAADALRQAIAETEQAQPEAWMMLNSKHRPTRKSLHWEPQTDWHTTWEAVPLYTSPFWRKPLTDDQIEEIDLWIEFKESGGGRIPTAKLVRYIEAKLKENT